MFLPGSQAGFYGRHFGAPFECYARPDSRGNVGRRNARRRRRVYLDAEICKQATGRHAYQRKLLEKGSRFRVERHGSTPSGCGEFGLA